MNSFFDGLYVVAIHKFLLSIVALCVLSICVQAAAPNDQLYKVSLLAGDQSEGERQKALKGGLEKVIIRISGQTELGDNVTIQEALANADVYLQQFSYVSLSDAEKAELRVTTDAKKQLESKSKTNNKPGSVPTIKIDLSFTPDSIKALLRRAQLPIWPANRPSVLVWVVTDSGAGKRQLSQSDQGQSSLLKEASRRGLPVVLPMNDLKDQVVLSAARLWDLDQIAITEASQRYGEDSVLVGRVSQTSPGVWQGNWLYLLKGQSWLIESNGDDLEEFLVQGVNEVIKIQVQRYGISPDSKPSTAFIDISGVESVKGYASTLLFLKNLDSVKSLRVSEVNGGLLRCALDINGDSQSLRELIALDSVLISEDGPASSAAGDAAVPALLRYRLSAQ